jgi:hypothetical protein
MNILTLSIKQKYLGELLAGKKKQEFREIRPKNFNRYIRYVYNDKKYKEGKDIPCEDNDKISLVPVKYDALKLLTGEYKDERPYVIVEIKSASIMLLIDEDGNDIICEEDGVEYIATEITYELGNILETQLYNNSLLTRLSE